MVPSRIFFKYLLSFLLTGIFLYAHISGAREKIFIPSQPQKKAPLFVSLHGCLSDAAEGESITKMSEWGERYGFYVYYPEPELGPDSKGCFDFYNHSAQNPGDGDAAAIVAKIHSLIATYDIDSQKVFVMGMSAGASLVSVLTSCYPEVFKGAAIHSGMAYGLVSNWQESLLVAQAGPLALLKRNTICHPSEFKGHMILLQGSTDSIMNTRHFRQLTKDYFGSSKAVTRYQAPELGHYGYVHKTYVQDGHLKGQSIYVYGMNHIWSGTSPLGPLAPRGPDASALIVNSFLKEDH